MAQETDGWRKLPDLGNTQQNTFYTWNIPEAYCGSSTNFEWKVQAIDHNFAGSDFSTTGSFSLDLTAISTITYINAAVSGGTADGSSWANAFTDLNTALQNLSLCTQEIWIASGTYKPTDETTPFEIPEGIKVYGGFTGTENILDERDWAAHPTILSGDINSDGIANTGDAHTVVRIAEDKVTLDGFIIEHGFA